MGQKFRVIDRRNGFFGAYKYQLRFSSFHQYQGEKFCGTGAIRAWLTDTFGPEWNYRDDLSYYNKDRNPLWHTVKSKTGGTPYLYLKGDEELSMVLMRWTH